jgi:hypothetical protein
VQCPERAVLCREFTDPADDRAHLRSSLWPRVLRCCVRRWARLR